ncbi:MAG: DUF3343 domain-containing protein [Treponema sp.]|jgi:N6-adenosine-specific RNA methylase IME4|nr:DUF3343 domain-containing protein [Treponema sp.]
MENINEVIICFESVSRAIMAEGALRAEAFNVRVMPVPSGIKGGCGFCLRFSPEDIEKAVAFLSERGFDINEVWKKSETTGTYRKVIIQGTDGGAYGKGC